MFPTGVRIIEILEGANPSVKHSVAAATVVASVADRRDKFFMLSCQNGYEDYVFSFKHKCENERKIDVNRKYF